MATERRDSRAGWGKAKDSARSRSRLEASFSLRVEEDDDDDESKGLEFKALLESRRKLVSGRGWLGR